MMLLGERQIRGADLRGRAAAVEAERGVMIFFSALQFPTLLRANGGVSFFAHW